MHSLRTAVNNLQLSLKLFQYCGFARIQTETLLVSMYVCCSVSTILSMICKGNVLDRPIVVKNDYSIFLSSSLITAGEVFSGPMSTHNHSLSYLVRIESSIHSWILFLSFKSYFTDQPEVCTVCQISDCDVGQYIDWI